MNSLLKKETVEELMKQDGNVKGEVFRTHAEYIRYREGESGIKKVEKRLEDFGYPLNFKEVKGLEWYKEALSVLVVLVAKDVFLWEEKDIFDMGNSAPKHSFIVKMFVKHFFSIKDIFEKAGQYWEKHFDFGSLEKGEFNEEEKYITVIVRGYKFDKVVAHTYFEGYFTRIAQFSIKSKNIKTKIEKSVFNGDPYNEYRIEWC